MSMEELFREHHEWALRVARRVVGHTQDAEDVVSEVFLAAMQALAAGRGPRENVRAYLRRAIQNAATRVYARRQVEQAAETLPEQPTVDHAERVIRAVLRARLLDDRPAAWRKVLLAVDVGGYTLAETGECLGMSSSAVAAILHRARTALRLAEAA